MMRQSQAAQRAPRTRYPQTLAHLRGTQLTQSWTQPLKTAFPAHTLMTYWYGQLPRNIENEWGCPCKLSKGSDWTKTQIKRIGDSHQAIWGHDQKTVRSEWKCALVEDCTAFEMRRMMTRTDQLICIVEATGSRVYTRVLEAGAHGSAKALVLSLKQFHAHFYLLYERVPPGQWWAFKASTLATSSSIQMYWQMWAISCSACGVLNLEKTLRWLLHTLERCSID